MASENSEELENKQTNTEENPQDNLRATPEGTERVEEVEGAESSSAAEMSESESAADAPDLEKLKKIVEGAIFAASKPMTIDQLGALFGEDERPSRDDFRRVLAALTEDYADRGVMLHEVSSGFRFQVREDVGIWVSRLWEEKPARYSRALLETLALIAYRQPITRGEIEEIRGVSTSSHIMKTLQERDWIRVVGHRDVPGRPAMYATTRHFLDYFNLKNIDELPSLAEIRDLDEINRELDLGVGPASATAGEALEVDDVDLADSEALDTDDLALTNSHEEASDPDQQTEVDSEETGYTTQPT